MTSKAKKYIIFCRQCSGMKNYVLNTPMPSNSEVCFPDCPHADIYLSGIKDLDE